MILQALCGYYERVAGDPGADVPRMGYARNNVSACIVLNKDGDVKAIRALSGDTGKKPRPVVLITPERPKRAGQRPEPAFLCENAEFLFGIFEKPDDAAYRFEASREIHENVLGQLADDGAQAILHFFAKRTPGRYDVYGVDSKPLEANGNIIFQLQGDIGYLHERPAVREAWEAYRAQLSGEMELAQCLVTGKIAPVARIHGNISGFGTDKPTLVSFNKKSFESYGKVQGMNAPVSEAAAFQYITALNLLISDRRHRINLNGDKVVFWAERDGQEEQIVSMFYDMDQSAENAGLDEEACQQVKATATLLLQGKQPAELNLDPTVRLYILGLSATRTRLVIRFFHTDTFGSLVERVRQHYEDINICARERTNPSPYWLAKETALERDSAKVAPNLEGALMRSILGGTAYPYMMFQQMMMRVRAEAAGDPKRNKGYAFSRERIGFIKGYLNRRMRLDGINEKERMTVALNDSERSMGYLLGRLMALIEKAQKEAIPNVNASVVDKYLNAALATPQMVFSTLLPLFEKYVSKQAKDDRPLGWLKKQVGEIIALMPSSGFPATLNAEEQGKFMIGYYHQNQALYTKKTTTEKTEEE